MLKVSLQFSFFIFENKLIKKNRSANTLYSIFINPYSKILKPDHSLAIMKKLQGS